MSSLSATRSAATSQPVIGPADLSYRLAEPFAVNDVHFKPQVVKGNRALAIAYIDARAVMDRLDETVGVGGWQDEYTVLADGSVMCRLKVRVGRVWITKVDVGSPSEQPDGGDRMKAAVSDALKRAAVKFGIGRYLYSLPIQWCDYDPAKKQFVSRPRLAEWAMARISPAPSRNGSATKTLPADGPELHRRLCEFDAELAGKGLCQVGALLAHVTEAGTKAGFGSDVPKWSGPALTLAVAEAKAFKARLADMPATASR
jgi:Rad52/22 family double-strand break repair protein